MLGIARALDKGQWVAPAQDLHIDGGQTTVGDGTADSAGKREARVQSRAAQLLGLDLGLSLLLQRIEVDAAGRGRGRSRGAAHCV